MSSSKHTSSQNSSFSSIILSQDKSLVMKACEIGTKLFVDEDLQSILDVVVSLIPGGEQLMAIKDIALKVEDTKTAIKNAETNVTSK